MLSHMVKDLLRFAFLYLEFYLPFGKKRVHLEIWKFNDMSVVLIFFGFICSSLFKWKYHIPCLMKTTQWCTLRWFLINDDAA